MSTTQYFATEKSTNIILPLSKSQAAPDFDDALILPHISVANVMAWPRESKVVAKKESWIRVAIWLQTPTLQSGQANEMQLQTLKHSSSYKFGSEQFQTASNLAAITSFSETNLFQASKRSMPQDLHANYLTHSVALRVSLGRGKHQGFPNILYISLRVYLMITADTWYTCWNCLSFCIVHMLFLLWVMGVWPWS